jgi:DNA-binding beta-propeller fold protein YncE
LDPDSNELLVYDLTTGAATAIGSLGIQLGYCGLTYDCTTDRLIAASSTEKALYEINSKTGEAELLKELDLTFTGMGIDYDPQGQQVRISNGTSLYALDMATHALEKKGDFSFAGVNDLALMQTCD